MNNKRNYIGKSIFVGIDVHKKTYSLAVVCDGERVKQDTIPAYPSKVVSYLQKFFAGANIKSAYEAGFSGFGLHRYLCKQGINNIVVHAASIEIGSRDRIKNDKRDATKIATQLAANRLRGIYIPDPEMEDRRELTRIRDTLVKDKTRMGARIKQKANYHGLIGPEDSQKVCKKWFNNLKEKDLKPGLKYALETLIEQWFALSNKIKEIDEILKEQGATDIKHEVIYRSVPGVGATAARVLANELGDMRQFSSERKLFSYTGLTPSEHSSGEHVRRGHISRQGKPLLRSILVQSCWIAIRHDKNLRETYERIARRAGAKRAIVATARRLIGKVRACFQKGEVYRITVEEEVAA